MAWSVCLALCVDQFCTVLRFLVDGAVDESDLQGGLVLPQEEGREGEDAAPLPPSTSLTSNKPLSASQGSLRSIDNDSSATMSADEGPPGSSSTSAPPQSFPPGHSVGGGGDGGPRGHSLMDTAGPIMQ
jgi:hypothetical protein